MFLHTAQMLQVSFKTRAEKAEEALPACDVVESWCGGLQEHVAKKKKSWLSSLEKLPQLMSKHFLLRQLTVRRRFVMSMWRIWKKKSGCVRKDRNLTAQSEWRWQENAPFRMTIFSLYNETCSFINFYLLNLKHNFIVTLFLHQTYFSSF